MDIKTVDKEGILVVELGGEINISSSPELKRAFEKVQAAKVVMNLTRVSYIDSSGLATLVEILKKVKGKGGALMLTNVSDKVRSLFEITKLDKLFGIYASDEVALKSFK